MAKFATVDEYIESFPAEKRTRLRELRMLSQTCAPGAVESLKWGSPAYSLNTILFVFAGYTNHVNFVFTPSTREAFAAELSPFKTGKGSVQIPYSEPVPEELLGRMIEHRIREYKEDGVLWM
ncbi:hypothetical protein GCM10022261_09970 [Brevibacterium daeguense]|uniref:YdhG-like domain-containing protein n=1 Tax=Brevibacterium daeguense TaxID=909936 RepID=A0ABP8EHL6_9MICO|nr:DUF1801 domain-containing protein [Brevibacterium daeguense]